VSAKVITDSLFLAIRWWWRQFRKYFACNCLQTPNLSRKDTGNVYGNVCKVQLCSSQKCWLSMSALEYHFK